MGTGRVARGLIAQIPHPKRKSASAAVLVVAVAATCLTACANAAGTVERPLGSMPAAVGPEMSLGFNGSGGRADDATHLLSDLPPAEEHVQLRPSMFLSSKTPYYSQQHGEYEAMPPQCRLVHVNHLARHGSRHSTKLKHALTLYNALAEGLRAGALTETGMKALSWAGRYLDAEAHHLGLLTADGHREHAETAERLWMSLGEQLLTPLREGRGVVFESSLKSRAIGSRDAFVHGFAAAAHGALEASVPSPAPLPDLPAAAVSQSGLPHFAMHNHTVLEAVLRYLTRSVAAGGDGDGDGDRVLVVEPPRCPTASSAAAATTRAASPAVRAATPGGGRAPGVSPVLEYAKLRFFDTCSAFQQHKKAKAWAPQLAPYTANAARPSSHERALLHQLFSPAYLDGEEAERGGVSAGTGAGARGGAVGKKGKKVGGGKRHGAAVSPQALAGKKGKKALSAEIVAALYSACQMQANAYGVVDQFCSLFEGHLNVLAKYELLNDLHDYHKQGAADPVAFVSACALVEDFIAAGDEGAGLSHPSTHTAARVGRATRAGGAPRSGILDVGAQARAARRGAVGHFRFGHSETVMPFISFLGLYQEPYSPSLHDYYHAQLSRGTAGLLEATLRRMAEFNTTHHLRTWEEAGEVEEDVRQGRLQGQRRPLPFSAALMLALKHPWSGARLIPMGANVQWQLWDCGDAPQPPSTTDAPAAMHGIWAKMLHNEREVHFPPCSHATPQWAAAAAAPSPHYRPNATASSSSSSSSVNAFAGGYGLTYPCPWEVVREYYRTVVYARHGITTCDEADWVRVCGGVAADGCESDEDG